MRERAIVDILVHSTCMSGKLLKQTILAKYFVQKKNGMKWWEAIDGEAEPGAIDTRVLKNKFTQRNIQVALSLTYTDDDVSSHQWN